MSKLPWFRFYSEALRDTKLDMICEETGFPMTTVIGAFTILLCLANDSPKRGALYVTFQKRFSNADVTRRFRMSAEETDILLKAFVEYEIIEIKDKAYTIKNWNKRQFESDNSTARVKKHRTKVTETLQECYSNAPDTDTESYTETETDKDNNNNDFAEVIKHYEKNIGVITPRIAELIGEDFDEYGKNICIGAMDVAIESNQRKWSYVKGIMRNWKTDGVTPVIKSNGKGFEQKKEITIDYGDGIKETRVI